jgi:retron-type reverse transcriptase
LLNRVEGAIRSFVAKLAIWLTSPPRSRAKLMLKANGQRGVPQGGVISPLLSNLYLTEVDRMLERAKETKIHEVLIIIMPALTTFRPGAAG